MAKITKTKSGNYTARIVIGHDENGRPIQKRLTHYDKATLRLMVAQQEAEKRNIIRRKTVTEIMSTFITGKEAVLSPSTFRVYNNAAKYLKTHYERFCGLYADNITTQNVQRLVNDLVSSGKAPKTVRNYHGFLSAAFKYSGYVLPMVTLPQPEPPQITIPEQATMKKILSAADGTRLYVPLSLAMMGVRRSEICALTLDDLNGDALTIHAAKVLGQHGEYHTKTTKTYSSTRTILIPHPLAEKIREQGYIWDSTPTALTNAFRKFLVANGLPHYRLHDLRHFFASYCHNVLKLSDKQIQSMTGHKTSEVLRRVYIHTMDQNKVNKTVARKMANFL